MVFAGSLINLLVGNLSHVLLLIMLKTSLRTRVMLSMIDANGRSGGTSPSLYAITGMLLPYLIFDV